MQSDVGASQGLYSAGMSARGFHQVAKGGFLAVRIATFPWRISAKIASEVSYLCIRYFIVLGGIARLQGGWTVKWTRVKQRSEKKPDVTVWLQSFSCFWYLHYDKYLIKIFKIIITIFKELN